MRILITGHSGLLGSNLMRELLKAGHDVYGVSRTDRYLNGYRAYTADLTDSKAAEEIFSEVRPEVVYHLAANGSEARGQISPTDMTERGVLLSVNVFKAAINSGVRRIIYASSISVYGDSPTPYSEFSTPQPKDVYGINKLAAEQILRLLAKLYEIEYVILRPHNIYGPGQNMADTSKNVVALFMRKLIEKSPYVLYGNGEMLRAFSYVDDVVKVFEQALNAPDGLICNVGSTFENSIKGLSDMLQVVTGISDVPIETKPSRAQEMHNFIAAHALQSVVFSYANTPLREGLMKTWEWVKSMSLPEVIKQEDEICLPR